jgi:hypothetical protein
MGSGWKVAIVNECDYMTTQAEAMWLDALERIPDKTILVFTTNNLHRLTDRFRRRCEVYRFDASGPEFKRGLEQLVKRVWQSETGKKLSRLPDDLGKFELASSDHSIALAIQQITPFIRAGETLPPAFQVPIVRNNASAPETTIPPLPTTHETNTKSKGPNARSQASKPSGQLQTPPPNHDSKLRPNASSKKVSPGGGENKTAKTAPTRVFCRKCRKWIRKGEWVRDSEVGTVHAGC